MDFEAVVTAPLFLAALFLSPLIGMVPAFATAPALVMVGIFMFRYVARIQLASWADTAAAFLVIVLMPLTYSISLG